MSTSRRRSRHIRRQGYYYFLEVVAELYEDWEVIPARDRWQDNATGPDVLVRAFGQVSAALPALLDSNDVVVSLVALGRRFDPSVAPAVRVAWGVAASGACLSGYVAWVRAVEDLNH